LWISLFSYDLDYRHFSRNSGPPLSSEFPSRIVPLILFSFGLAIVIIPYGSYFDLPLFLRHSSRHGHSSMHGHPSRHVHPWVLLLWRSCHFDHRHLSGNCSVPFAGEPPAWIVRQPLIRFLFCVVVVEDGTHLNFSSLFHINIDKILVYNKYNQIYLNLLCINVSLSKE